MRAFFAKSLPENPFLLAILLLFCGIFFGVLLWQFRASKREEHKHLAQLPLQD